MIVQKSELLGDCVGLQSRMLPGNHALGSPIDLKDAELRVFLKDRAWLLSHLKRLESEAVMRYTNGLLPEDLAFTPQATEVRMYRSGVKTNLPMMEKQAAECGLSLEAAVLMEEAAAAQLQEEIRRIRLIAESTTAFIQALTVEQHRKLDATFLILECWRRTAGIQ